jgi:tRNA A-37 threonylcarbamoyl transferase component Bud32
MEDLTGKQLGQYRIVAPLGEGGMAAVYKAYQASVERYVALKILPRHYASDPNFVARFKREARVIAGLAHPAILPVHDYGEVEGYTYIVMRYVEGGTLANFLQGKPLPLSQTCHVISQVAAALDYAHAKGVVHRDVKPSNVLLDEQGNCLLSDFGIARMVEATGQFTATGAFIGTPTYASPEQALGHPLDGRSDVYSLGVMLYEMTTGRPPFDAETPMAILIKHVHDPLPMPRTVNPALSEAVERVILKALAKEPESRYQTAGEMARALAAVVTAEVAAPTRAVPAPTAALPGQESRPAAAPWPRPAGVLRIPIWGWILGGLVILCLIAGLLGGGSVLVSYLVRGTATATSVPVARPTAALTTGATLPAIPTAAPATTTPGVTLPAIPTVAPTPTTAPSVSAKASTPTSRTWQKWTQVQSFPAPAAKPSLIIRQGSALWVAAGSQLYQLSLEGDIVSEMEFPGSCANAAWDDEETLWCGSASSVYRRDLISGQQLASFTVDIEPIVGLAWDGEALWVIDGDGNLARYDKTGQRLQRLAVSARSSTILDLMWVEGEFWLIDTFTDVTRLDSEFNHLGWFRLCGASFPYDAATFWDGNDLWVADSNTNRISQCTPDD